MKILLLLCALLFTVAARAQVGAKIASLATLNTAGMPVTLTNCTIVAVNPDGVRVMHDAGITKVPFERLPGDMQAAGGFDPEKARVHREEKRTAEAEAAELRAKEAARQAEIEAKKARRVVAPKPARPAAPQPVVLRGDMLPFHRTQSVILRLHSTGRFVKISGSMNSETNRNGQVVVINAYPTTETAFFENDTIPVYRTTP